MMFGYATSETDYMPLSLDLSHALLVELANIRKNEPELMPYLRPGRQVAGHGGVRFRRYPASALTPSLSPAALTSLYSSEMIRLKPH